MLTSKLTFYSEIESFPKSTNKNNAIFKLICQIFDQYRVQYLPLLALFQKDCKNYQIYDYY